MINVDEKAVFDFYMPAKVDNAQVNMHFQVKAETRVGNSEGDTSNEYTGTTETKVKSLAWRVYTTVGAPKNVYG